MVGFSDEGRVTDKEMAYEYSNPLDSIKHIDHSNKYIYTESRAVKTQNMQTESSAVRWFMLSLLQKQGTWWLCGFCIHIQIVEAKSSS